jgi:AcrR family transcriptional regulator
MPRISKEPEKRRQDLIEAAKRLFMTKGYEQTAVSDIVKEIKVAQGTFYYHFRSKAEILEEVVRKSIFSLAEKLRLVAEREDTDALAKLNAFYDTLVEFGSPNNELIALVHDETNLMLHHKLAKTTISLVVPLLTKIIRDGTKEGVFKVAHSEETAKLLLLAVAELFHDPQVTSDAEHIQRARVTTEQSVERVLGLEEGSFRLNL